MTQPIEPRQYRTSLASFMPGANSTTSPRNPSRRTVPAMTPPAPSTRLAAGDVGTASVMSAARRSRLTGRSRRHRGGTIQADRLQPEREPANREAAHSDHEQGLGIEDQRAEDGDDADPEEYRASARQDPGQVGHDREQPR